MELRQESLFADETKGGIEVIYSKFIDQRRMDYKALFGGFDHLRVITFSYGLGFVETVADMFEDVEIIIGSMNTVRPDIVDVAMHQKLEMKRLSKRKQLVEKAERRAGREEEEVTVTGRAVLQRWRLVRMGDGWGRARIGASPYYPCPLRGRVCGERMWECSSPHL